MKLFQALTLISVLIAPYSALSQTDFFEYSPPTPLERVNPHYPTQAVVAGKAGHVVVNMMIATDGSVYDLVIVESADPMFEPSVLEALEQYVYEPAKLNGVPVDGSHSNTFTFELADTIQMGDPFLRTHRFFRDAMENGDIEKAQDYQERMTSQANTTYKVARAALSGFHIAKVKNQIDTQLEYLKIIMTYDSRASRSDSMDEEPRIFSDQEASVAYSELFKLQTQLKLYAEASSTFETIESREYYYVETLRPIYEQVQDLASNEVSYPFHGTIGVRNYWSIGLHKRTFYIDQVEGNLSEIKLHCDAKYVLFPYDEETDYSAPIEWGDCLLIVVGDKDTEFRLVQIPSGNQ